MKCGKYVIEQESETVAKLHTGKQEFLLGIDKYDKNSPYTYGSYRFIDNFFGAVFSTDGGITWLDCTEYPTYGYSSL